MEEIDQVLEDEGIEKPRLEAAIELARLVSADSGMCCQNLGKFVWHCYLKLEDQDESD